MAGDQRIKCNVTLTTGHVATLDVPIDFTAQDALGLIAYITSALPEYLAAAKSPASRIQVARGLPVALGAPGNGEKA